MESSLLEELLTREVDPTAVNAIVSSLDSRLAPSSNIVSNVTVGKVINPVHLGNGTIHLTANNTESIKSSATVGLIANSNRDASSNGSLPTGAVSSSTIVSSNFRSSMNSQSPTPGRLNAGVASSNSPSPAPVGTQVNIAPKGMLTSTVPIAPRMPATTIMLTPDQMQLIMAQQRMRGATLVPGSVVTRIAGGNPLTLVPRMANHQNIPMNMNMVAGGGPGISNIAPRLTVAGNQVNIAGIKPQGQATPSNSVLTQPKQDARNAIKLENTPRPTVTIQPALSASQVTTLPATTLTQVRGPSSTVPGAVTYRFRPVAPSTSGATQSVPLTNSASPANMMKESVKKLKEFFQNLINLASGSNQPPEIGKTVKELVHSVMQGKISEEEFVEKLQHTLKSDPQPNLVPFLQKTLPSLRESLNQHQKQPQPQTQPQTQGGHLQVSGGTPPSSSIKTQQVKVQPNKQIVNHPVQIPLYVSNPPSAGTQGAAQQIVMPKGLTPHLQQVLTKKLAQGGRVVIATVPQTVGSNKIPGTMTMAPSANQRTLGGKNPHHMALHAGHAQVVGAAGAGDKPKGRNFHYSSTISSADDDINDVTCMAGVNLVEESAKILSTGSDLLNTQTRSCKDETFLAMDALKRRVEVTGKKYGVIDVQGDVLAAISHAAEERLRNLLERLTVCSLHRVEGHKSDNRYEALPDVKSQLRVFEQIDEMRRKHNELMEREKLMKAAKSRSRTEDPEQAQLKEKAKQMQQVEEELRRKRAANKTALEAIGGKKRSKLDEALESLQDSQGPSSSNFGMPSLQNNPIRTRARRITMRDLQFVLEQDRTTSKSRVLFKSFLR